MDTSANQAFKNGLPVHQDEQVVNGPACRYLASKGQYITGFLNPAAENCGVGDGYCWCNQTQAHLGPDDEFVGRDRCTFGRTCYVELI